MKQKFYTSQLIKAVNEKLEADSLESKEYWDRFITGLTDRYKKKSAAASDKGYADGYLGKEPIELPILKEYLGATVLEIAKALQIPYSTLKGWGYKRKSTIAKAVLRLLREKTVDFEKLVESSRKESK